MNKNKKLALFLILTLPFMAYAGIDKVDSMLTTIIGWASATGAGVTALLLSVAGYRVAYKGQAVEECQKIIVGAIMIGAASFIANALF